MSESVLADELARGNGQAEELIAASRARYADGLGQIQLLEADESYEADLDEVAKAAGEKKVISATKRGENIVYAVLDEDGRTRKGFVPVADLGKKKSKPKETKEETKDSAKESKDEKKADEKKG